MTRGERNSNPGNIRHVKDVTWVGQSSQQHDEAFVQFDDAAYGIRAIARILLSYERKGLNTIEAIINRWAPPTENDAQAYVAAVCAECGVEATRTISIRDELPGLIKAIIHHENGRVIYTDREIAEGIALV